jgi:hypothetical protein
MLELLPADLIRCMGISFWQIALVNKACYNKFKTQMEQERLDGTSLIKYSTSEFIKFIASYKRATFKSTAYLAFSQMYDILCVRKEANFLQDVILKIMSINVFVSKSLLEVTAVELARRGLMMYEVQTLLVEKNHPDIYDKVVSVNPYFATQEIMKQMIRECVRLETFDLAEHIMKKNKIQWDNNPIDLNDCMHIQRLFDVAYKRTNFMVSVLTNDTYHHFPDFSYIMKWCWNENLVVALCECGKVKPDLYLLRVAVQESSHNAFSAMLDTGFILDPFEVLVFMRESIESGSLEIVKILVERCRAPVTTPGRYSPLNFSRSLEREEIHEYIKSVHNLRKKIGYKNPRGITKKNRPGRM